VAPARSAEADHPGHASFGSRALTTSAEPPLCVDLDGTLIRGDTLRISLRLLALRSPWLVPLFPFALLGGRPALKRFVATRFVPDAARLPWREDVLDFLRAERARGRRICLVTAADRLVAESVATHLGLFDVVIATELGNNLKGARKVDAIWKILSNKEFDYVGDSMADVPVFRAARYSYLVVPGSSLRRAVRTGCVVKGEFPA
jgi:hydroxymethylpyrimidine pyrophosphatase-like HAD family hydrolase